MPLTDHITVGKIPNIDRLAQNKLSHGKDTNCKEPSRHSADKDVDHCLTWSDLVYRVLWYGCTPEGEV